MKDKMKQILENLHKHNMEHIANINFGLSEDVVYDALVVAPSYSPGKVITDNTFVVTEIGSQSYCTGYEVKKDNIRIAWIKTAAGGCNMLDYLLICGELQFKKLVFIGATGALKKEFNIGDICTPLYSVAGTLANTYLKDSIKDHIPFEKIYPEPEYVDRVIRLAEESNIPFAECESWLDHSNAIFCSVCHDNKTISVINIHLPWDSVAERERQIVDIVAEVHNKKCDLVFMAGDFNCAETSDVHRFLMGECRLDQKEAVPRWYDLASAYAELTASEIEPTVNFRENPRFKHNTIELNSRFDRILLRNTYPCEFPVLRNCMIFGKTIYEDIQLSASDHYGVMVDIG